MKALWVRILTAKYHTSDVNGWSLGEEVNKSGSTVLKTWWRIYQGRSKVGNFFRSSLRLIVGKGNQTLFGGLMVRG